MIGRPKEYDRQEIANIMLTWADNPNNTSVTKFLADHTLDYDTIFYWCETDKPFSRNYSKMKLKIARNREAKAECGDMYFGVYAMHQRNYDPTIVQNIIHDKELDAKLRKEAPEGEVHIHLPCGKIKKTAKSKK